MKRLLVIALLIGQSSSPGVELVGIPNPPPVPVPASQPPRAWLGLQVDKPDATTTAHLPSLPPGIGFVIRSIDKAGPAKTAGLQELDLLWKIGDQMLVNEGQLAALLRLSKPGDEITLSGFRAGKPLEVKLKLGEAPVMKRPFPMDMMDSTILPGACGGPQRVINVGDKTASYSTDEGRVVVRRDGKLYKVKINGPNDELIYEGNLPDDGSLNLVPEPWRRRVHALRRGLDHALDGRMLPELQPRPRVVAPAVKKP